MQCKFLNPKQKQREENKSKNLTHFPLCDNNISVVIRKKTFVVDFNYKAEKLRPKINQPNLLRKTKNHETEFPQGRNFKRPKFQKAEVSKGRKAH